MTTFTPKEIEEIETFMNALITRLDKEIFEKAFQMVESNKKENPMNLNPRNRRYAIALELWESLLREAGKMSESYSDLED